MGDTPDLTVEILKQIRDGVLQTNARLDQTNARLDQTNARLDRVVQEQIRQSTAIVELERGHHDVVAGLAKVVDAVVSLDQRQRTLEQGQERIVNELQKLNVRLDNVILGPMGQTVRDTVARVEALEADVALLKRRTG